MLDKPARRVPRSVIQGSVPPHGVWGVRSLSPTYSPALTGPRAATGAVDGLRDPTGLTHCRDIHRMVESEISA